MENDVQVVDDLHELYILGIIADNPRLYLHEITSKIKEATSVAVDGSTVCRLLYKNGFTHKKIVRTAKQRCSGYRARFMADIHMKKMRDIWLFIMQASTLSHLLRYRKNTLEKDTKSNSFRTAGGLLAPYSSLAISVLSKQIPNMTGYLCCLTHHFTQCTEPDLSIGELGGMVVIMPITSLCVRIAQSRTLEHCSGWSV